MRSKGKGRGQREPRVVSRSVRLVDGRRVRVEEYETKPRADVRTEAMRRLGRVFPWLTSGLGDGW
jgi:hypothetical protein